MIAELRFTLPEEREDFESAVKAKDLFLALWNIEQKLRLLDKYGSNYESVDEAVSNIRDMFYQELEKYDISMNMLS